MAVALLVAASPGLARATDGGPHLTGLRVSEGGSWHASDSFSIQWDPAPPGSPNIVHWNLHPAEGVVSGLPIFGEDIEHRAGVKIRVPAVPGVYVFEARVWGAPETGPPVAAPLYFDNARPGMVAIEAPTWVAPGSTIPVQLSAPGGPVPISGIHGYAVSIDGAAAGSPCVASDRCTDGEIDLPGGIGDTATALRAPPEGISYIHASAVSWSGMRSITATREVGVDGTPPQVRLEGTPSGWADGPVRLTAIATDPLSGTTAAGPGGPVTAIGIDGAGPVPTPGASAGAIVAGQGVHEIVYWARDAVGNAGDGSDPFDHPGTATVRIDETDPVVRFLAGDPADPERIEATVADALSGPDPDRGSIAVRPVGSSDRFEPLPTDTHRGRLVARWSSDDFPHGPYEFRATGFDAAGNSTTTTLGEHGAAFVLQNPVKRETRLAFGFGARQLVFQRCSRADGSRRCHRTVVDSFGRRPAGRTVPCCHGAVVGGQLVDTDGAPLAEQSVEVVETFAAGTRGETRRTALTTDADGRFSSRLAPGPSREVTAQFLGTSRLTRTAGRRIRLRVRAAVHLRVSTARVHVGGPPVVFSGRIAHPEAPIPATGLPVQLEFRLPGMPWTEFRTVQSDGFGRFRYPYAFSDDDSAGVRFLFRAFVPATGDWPFAPATSRPVAVTG
ncbi:MAG TPA: carboxypeptidase-like regulatory domain-containing protein [Solirubrobacterales bacterium]|nr:carboxypeptidase-like regulatory domain-containing protein [Solirubrobacterales bacterium]